MTVVPIESSFARVHRQSRRRRILSAVVALLLAGGIGVAWHSGTFGCNADHPNNCDYNQRYKLMAKYPDLTTGCTAPLTMRHGRCVPASK